MEESQCQKKEELQTQITRVKQSIVELLEAKAEIALIMMSPIANMNTIPACAQELVYCEHAIKQARTCLVTAEEQYKAL